MSFLIGLSDYLGFGSMTLHSIVCYHWFNWWFSGQGYLRIFFFLHYPPPPPPVFFFTLPTPSSLLNISTTLPQENKNSVDRLEKSNTTGLIFPLTLHPYHHPAHGITPHTLPPTFVLSAHLLSQHLVRPHCENHTYHRTRRHTNWQCARVC